MPADSSASCDEGKLGVLVLRLGSASRGSASGVERHLAGEPQNIEQGISNDEGPCRNSVSRQDSESGLSGARTTDWKSVVPSEISVDKALATKNSQARRGSVTGKSANAGYGLSTLLVVFATFRGRRSPLALRNSTFLVELPESWVSWFWVLHDLRGRSKESREKVGCLGSGF